MWTSQALLPVISLLLGVALTHVVEVHRHKRDRQEQVVDALRKHRGDAYRAFIKNAHHAAHLIGRTAPDFPMPLPEPTEAWAAVDREVARDLYELKLFASEPTLTAARSMRGQRREFRQTVISGARYRDDAYLTAFNGYRDSRTMFLERARQELVTE